MIGRLRGASIFSTCLASPLSTALTAEHVSDPVKGLCAPLPRLMSGSSQGSAVSSRGGVSRVMGGEGGWSRPAGMLSLAVAEPCTCFFKTFFYE